MSGVTLALTMPSNQPFATRKSPALLLLSLLLLVYIVTIVVNSS